MSESARSELPPAGEDHGEVAQPGAWVMAFPPIPAAPSPQGRDTRVRAPLVAALSGLVGSLVGAALVLAAFGFRVPTATTTAEPPSFAPTVQVNGGEEVGRVAAVAAAVLPTVVRVDRGAGIIGGAQGNGSGVVYRSDGYIITNNHVVAGAEQLTVTLSDGTEHDAELVGADRDSDLAVLRVDRTDLTAIQIGDLSRLRVGDLAVAVGSPFGLDGSVTAGIISAVDRRPVDVRAPDGSPLSLVDVIQTDAPINPGNSGGPLVSGDARLIGINSAILTTGGPPGNAGVGFAIPAPYAVSIADELVATGRVRYAFLGVEGEDLSPQTAQVAGVEQGALVRVVQPGTPAAEAGLRPDDVITAVNDAPIDSIGSLVAVIRAAEVGDTVSVAYRRDGREAIARVTLAERPSSS